MAVSIPSITEETRDGLVFHVLREPSSGSEAWIIPEVGASCIRFQTTVDNQPFEVIRLPESWDAFRGHPTAWGSAVLFPFPGRIRGGAFHFGGTDYQLPINEPSTGNAIHGCVSNRPWSLIERSVSASDGASVTYQISTASQPELSEHYPFPFRLTLRLGLRDGQLSLAFLADNPGPNPMPIGLGVHPYFPLPLGGAGNVDDHEIWVDAPYFWEQANFMPIGQSRPAEASVDLRVPRSLRALASVGFGGPDKMLNFVHSQFSDSGEQKPGVRGVRWGVRNPITRRQVVVEADAGFPASVIWIPPTREKISFEPHTCLPNAFNLANEGRVAGRITLGPGEFWRGSLRISASATSS